MKNEFLRIIEPKLKLLAEHSLYGKIDNHEKLCLFMEHHVYAVFDFMSLIKSLQHSIAPSTNIWTPPKHRSLARFVNEIILCEESDETPNGDFMSHMELYLESMNEVRANSDIAHAFIRTVEENGIDKSLDDFDAPLCTKEFMRTTFDIINEQKITAIASSFCFGREKVIPLMFQGLLDKMNISQAEAPMFHYYLERHIEVDGDSHGPMAIKMLEILCGDDPELWSNAIDGAVKSLDARVKLWDQIEKKL